MTLWSFAEAKRAGYKVDEKALSELATWSVAKDDPGKIITQPTKDSKQARQSIFRMTIGLAASDPKDPVVKAWLAKAGTILAADQIDEGAWQVGDGRQPLIASKEVTTTTVLLALASPVVAESKEAAAREKGLKWLQAQPFGDDLQAVALRLILIRRLGKLATESAPLVKAILERQKPDGGWSQSKEMGSDAFATGQALFALAEAGVKLDDPAIRKGQAFLVSKQRREGSWPMVSRPMKPGGEGAKNIDPITHAGVAWAVMGLARTAPALATK